MQERAILSLEQFLERHPWPAERLAEGRPLEWLWSFDLEAETDALWERIIDTSRMNRALGLGEMNFEERGGVLHGWGKNGGVRQEWVEVPWEWVWGKQLLAQRVYSRGFGRYVRSIFHLEPLEPGHVRLYVYFGWLPRGLIGGLALRIGMPSIGRAYGRVLSALAEEMRGARVVGAGALDAPPELSEEGRSRLEAAHTQLIERGLERGAVNALIGFVRTADDMDAYRIQVRRVAREWGVPERELLVTCLHATRIGLLELSWDVICPHCRGVRDEAPSLGKVAAHGSCDVCKIDFDTDTINAVEITFHVHPSVRDVPKVYYCSAEPSTKVHIKVQQALAPGETRHIASALRPGLYRMRTIASASEVGGELDVTSGSAAAAPVSWCAGNTPAAVQARPQPELTLENRSDEACTFVVEEQRWAEVALRPAALFNLQEFRDLFSEEYLAVDVQLNVGEQAILFTDMVGSTRFYADRGDPVAFAELKKHFVQVYDAVAQHNGAVIKTIGDAVMASFAHPLDALRSAREIHRRFPPLAEGDTAAPIRLRISINAGACIAVNLNASIDYFGGTVNLAAKLQACAEAGDIAISNTVRAAAGVEAYLAEQRARLDEGVYESKALSPVPYTVWHTDPALRRAPLASIADVEPEPENPARR